MSFQQQQPNPKTFQSKSKSQLKGFLISIVLFCFFYPAFTTTIHSSFLPQQMISGPLSHSLEAKYQEENLQSNPIFFDEKNADSFNTFESNPVSPLSPPVSIKLSMGKTLSTLNIDAYSVILTKDGKTAFVAIADSTDIKILDVSNLQKPTAIGSIRLSPPEYPFLLKTLALSPDEKTLFVSNMHCLDLIDISNVGAPLVLGHLKDQNLTDNLQKNFYSKKYPFDYRVSMAVSKDQNNLFIAGMGLQVIDISDRRKPVFIDSNTKQVEEDNLFLSEVRISPNGETLYLANGTLNIYNISNVRALKLLGSYSIPSYSISSVSLSKQDENIAYIAGFTDSQKSFFEKINIKNPSNPIKLQAYDLNYKSKGALYILNLAFNETIAYIFAYPQKFTSETGVFNLRTQKFKVEQGSPRKSITSLATFPSDEQKVLVAQNLDTLEIIDLYKNFPNNRIYSFANISIGKLPFDDIFYVESLALSSDSNILIVKGNHNLSSLGLQIINVSDPFNPQFLSNFSTPIRANEIKYLDNVRKIAVVSEWNNSISFLSLSQDFKSIELTSSFSKKGFGKIASYQVSSDGKFGSFVCIDSTDSDIPEDTYLLRTFDFSDPSSSLKILNETKLNIYKHKSFLTKDNRFLYIVGSRIIIYNVSNPQTPRELSSTLIDFHDQESFPKFAHLSSDEKTIYTRTYDGFSYSFRIYDVQNFSAVKLLSDLPLPKTSDMTGVERDLLFTPDYKLAYMGCENGHMIAINISNQTAPFVQGTFVVQGEVDVEIVKMWKDGKTILYSSHHYFRTARFEPPFSLYIDTESVRLGEKYSKSTALFQLNKNDREYEIFDDEYKFIKASLFDAKINKNKRAPECSYLPFPSWIDFNKQNQILTLEPKNQENLGTYTLYSAFSRRFPREGFKSIQLALNKSKDDDDLLMMMISLGFLDQRLFLTPNFGEFDDFAIATPSNLPLKERVYAILQQYYFETFTSFDVFPSLDVRDSDKISVSTLSENSIRVEIVLSADNKFINKQYGSIKPTILGSQIILEGSQKDINNALELLVINLQNMTEPCEGTVTISDRLNPVVIKSFADISKLFKINEQPQVKIPIQSQINSNNIETGTYFTINFQNGTFVDTWNNDLSFELASGEPGKSVPLWISFGNMSLRGTPPEEIIWKELKFNLIVKNEFKETEVPFTIKVKLSPTFALKLLIRYSPYILTVIGLIVYANRIYNIVFKKRYRYPRDFSIKVGEEITSSVIPPMIFIWKEKQESKLILKFLKARVTQELGKNSIKNIEFAEYFANSERSRVDMVKLENNIQETLKEVPEKIIKKLRSYFHGSQASKNLIKQIIFNQLTFWLLETNLETKKFFDIIKGDWIDLVDWDINGMCKIKESQFLELVAQADLHLENNSLQEKDDNYSLMTENEFVKEVVNVNLLKDAIKSHAFNKQSIDYHSTSAHIMIKSKMETNFIKRFMKMDLEEVNFSDRGKMTYGIHFKVQNDVLSFHGIPEEKFLDKTVVVQITTKKQRILNEIWIHGVSKVFESHSRDFEPQEEIAKGTNYEIY